ncbi:MAG: hypothetical protein IJP21_01065 [Clostridia bacterium]|nr:hypothetical protein [Clostridia bacterium]
MKVYENGIYREMTAEEIDQNVNTPEMQIEALMQNLADTDYKAIKYAEGLISEEDYAPIKKQRQQWRNEINLLELEL